MARPWQLRAPSPSPRGTHAAPQAPCLLSGSARGCCRHSCSEARPSWRKPGLHALPPRTPPGRPQSGPVAHRVGGHSSAVQRAGSVRGGIAPPGRLCPHRSAQRDPMGAPEWEGSAKRGRPLSGATVLLSRFHASLLAHGSLARAHSGYQLGIVLSTNPHAGPCPAPGQRPAAGDCPGRTLGPQGPP